MPPLTSGYDDLTVTLSQILFPIVVLLGVSGIIVGSSTRTTSSRSPR